MTREQLRAKFPNASEGFIRLNADVFPATPFFRKPARSKKRWVVIGGRNMCFRSSWEIFYAKHLELLKKSGETEVYKVDSRVLAPPERTPELQNDLHNVLQKAGAGLQDGRFAIGKIEPLRDENGKVTAYQVEIKH